MKKLLLAFTLIASINIGFSQSGIVDFVRLIEEVNNVELDNSEQLDTSNRVSYYRELSDDAKIFFDAKDSTDLSTRTKEILSLLEIKLGEDASVDTILFMEVPISLLAHEVNIQVSSILEVGRIIFLNEVGGLQDEIMSKAIRDNTDRNGLSDWALILRDYNYNNRKLIFDVYNIMYNAFKY